ncbi:MAG TPA: HEPN domain-containing protein [Bryobacteraceae bacterium]
MLNDFATRCFRDVADGDYIAARMALRANLLAQFLWSSHQAVEKYLKAILLINRTPCLSATHGVSDLLSKVENIRKLRFKASDETRSFVVYLDTYGRWSRYLETSFHVTGSGLISLDQAVWEIRRYCSVLEHHLKSAGGKITPMLEHELQRIELSNNDPKGFHWYHGEVETILHSRKHPARAGLIWKNFYFGLRIKKTIRLNDWLRSVNAPLALHPEFFDEIRKYVFLPKAMVREFEELTIRRARLSYQAT